MQTQKLLLEIPRQMLLFFIVVYCVSCRCDDKMCKGLEDKYVQWIPTSNIGDSIRFVNNFGGKLSFAVIQREIPVDRIADCTSSFMGGCRCDACVNAPVAGEIVYMTGDTSRRIIDSSGNVLQSFTIAASQITQVDSQSVATLQYRILDHANTISVAEGVSYMPNHEDSLLPSFTIGSRTYSNVVVHQVDSTVNNPQVYYPAYNAFFIYKSWFNKEYGVIAFYDLFTQSLYYRE